MPIDWFRQFKAPSQEEIRSLEQRLKVKLPGDYTQFLMESGGGMPKMADFIISQEDGSDTCVGVFLGVHAAGRDSILEVTQMRPEGMPNTCLPMARDPGGDYVVFRIDDGMARGVYFWQHEAVGTPDELVPLADTFSEFFNSLAVE